MNNHNNFTLNTDGSVFNAPDAFTNKPNEIDFVFGGVMARTVTSLVGAGGTGKSYLGLGIIADLATGADVLGLGIPQSDEQTVYLTVEDPVEVLRHRVYNLGKLYTVKQQQQILNKATIESQLGAFLQLVNSKGQINHDLVESMSQAFSGKRLVIIDTLRRFHGADENDSSQMNALIYCLEQIAEKSGTAILFLHHTNKASNSTGSCDAGASRGSAVLTDNIRGQINLNVMSEKEANYFGISDSERLSYVKFTNSKINYKKSADCNWLRRCEGGVLKKVILSKKKLDKSNRRRSV